MRSDTNHNPPDKLKGMKMKPQRKLCSLCSIHTGRERGGEEKELSVWVPITSEWDYLLKSLGCFKLFGILFAPAPWPLGR